MDLANGLRPVLGDEMRIFPATRRCFPSSALAWLQICLRWGALALGGELRGISGLVAGKRLDKRFIEQNVAEKMGIEVL